MSDTPRVDAICKTRNCGYWGIPYEFARQLEIEIQNLEHDIALQNKQLSEHDHDVKWTSIKDRLPPENTHVLAYMEDRGTVILTHFYKDFALIRYGQNNFESFDKLHGVTHWAEITPPL